MSVLNPDYADVYAAAGTTGPYPITFSCILDVSGNASDIIVQVTDSNGVSTDITATSTVTGLNVYTAIAYDATYTIILLRYPATTQPYTFPYGTKFPSKTFENALDRLAYLIQKGAGDADQALKAPLAEVSNTIGRIPSIGDRANRLLGFDAGGDPIASDGYVTAVTPFMATVLDDTTSDAARATLAASGISNYEGVSSTPYTQSSSSLTRLFLVTTGASNLVFNIAAAVDLIGKGPFTVMKIDSGAGAVVLTPNGADVWDKAGNVACYLGKRWEALTFSATASGVLGVAGGVFVPSQGVDTNGSQPHLGKLIHAPLGNTNGRTIVNAAPPSAGAWSSAQSVTGLYGVPAGAVAVRVKARAQVYATAAGEVQLSLAFSDNNSNTPTTLTAHPVCGYYGYASAAGQAFYVTVEIDIPLNSSGQLFIYTLTSTNNTLASSRVALAVVGYYMGV